MLQKSLIASLFLLAPTVLLAQPVNDTLPPLGEVAPANLAEMWAGFDPRAEPLETETLREWEEEGIVFRIVRFRIGVFRGQPAKLAAVYGFPQREVVAGKKLPGLVQIHGGGQYADANAVRTNARRGYATVSIAWAGRINAPGYRVTPQEVKLFWDGATDDPNYKLTTDWGALDGYHAPGRNAGNAFPSARPAEWTLDAVESPRNSGWYLCALAARRALTFLERQGEVDAERLGVYGHSMGGKLTVMTSVDARVKAAAPSCGGISDRDNVSALFRATLGDDVSLREVACPILFLSPANDFHGRIGDLPAALREIRSTAWRATCAPHHNHQDTAEYEVATQLWFDQHLKGNFVMPNTPDTELVLQTESGVPLFHVQPDASRRVLGVDVFTTQQGKSDETARDMQNTVHRYWHHAAAKHTNGRFTAHLPLASAHKPLWVYANVLYALDAPVTGAGYYYGTYTTSQFNLSSRLHRITPERLADAGVRATRRRTRLIESFADDWEKEWFTYRPQEWARSTHKLYSEVYRAPADAELAIEVRAEEANVLVVRLDESFAEVPLQGGNSWQSLRLGAQDFQNVDGEPFAGFDSAKRLTLSASERFRPPRGSGQRPRVVGGAWQGRPPQFRELRWVPPAQ